MSHLKNGKGGNKMVNKEYQAFSPHSLTPPMKAGLFPLLNVVKCLWGHMSEDV